MPAFSYARKGAELIVTDRDWADHRVLPVRRTGMTDDTHARGPQDRGRININQDHELRYWTQTLGVTEAQILRAVGAVGVSVDKVRDYLRVQGEKSH